MPSKEKAGQVVDEKWHYRHDMMNLLVLPFVFSAVCYYLFIDRSEYYYWLSYWIFQCYMMVDFLWLIILPKSVASPLMILAHHALCLLGWNIPLMPGGAILYPWTTSAVLVEINTIFLTARRNFRSITIFTPLFYLSWVGLRLIMYPILMVQLLSHYFHRMYHVAGGVVLPETLTILVFLMLNLLNFHWTYNLLAKDKSQPKDQPSKGL